MIAPLLVLYDTDVSFLFTAAPGIKRSIFTIPLLILAIPYVTPFTPTSVFAREADSCMGITQFAFVVTVLRAAASATYFGVKLSRAA